METSKQILNGNIGRIIIGLTEIGNLEIDDFEMNMNIAKSISNLGVAEKAYTKTLKSIMNKYMKKDEKGGFVVENNSYVFNSDADKESYNKELEALNETVVSETVYKLKTSKLKGVKGVKGTTLAKCYEMIEDDNTASTPAANA